MNKFYDTIFKLIFDLVENACKYGYISAKKDIDLDETIYNLNNEIHKIIRENINSNFLKG